MNHCGKNGDRENRSVPVCLSPAVTRALVLALLAAAVFFRLCDLSARNLWTDEAWVALAVLAPTAAEVLARGQSTPPLYLLTLWLLAKIAGGSETVLRSLSFGFGVGAVALFWPWARTLATPGTALFGLAAMAASPVLVYFSKELKQYSGDAFFAVLLFLLAERLLARPGRGRGAALAAAGVLSLGYSHPAMFVLPVVLALLWSNLRHARGLIGWLALLWGISFALGYVLVFRHQANPELVAYWAQDFPDFTGPRAFLIWLGPALARYLTYFLGEWALFWAPPALFLGLTSFALQGRARVLAYLGGPLLLALAAAALHRYPFMAHYSGSRLMLFSAPALYLVAANGVSAAITALWREPWRPVAAALTALVVLLLQPVTVFRENYHTTINREEIKPLVALLEQHRQPGDLIYVYYYAVHPFRYYFRGDLNHVCWGKTCVEQNLSLERPTTRVWLLAAHFPRIEYMENFAKGLLGPGWMLTYREIRRDALLFRFDRLQDPGPTSRTGPPGPNGCGFPVRPPEKVCG
jgi:hypothetical protein